MKFSLIDLETNAEFVLPDKSEITIGRALDNDFCIPPKKYWENKGLRKRAMVVSRYHCTILNGEKEIKIFDRARGKGSRNGTFVNDSPVFSETILKNGDNIRVADYKLKVRINNGLKDSDKLGDELKLAD